MTDPELQAADRVITLHIKQALAVIEIRLLVNIVVGADGTVSLAILGV
jgi:DNA repair protein RadC